MSADVKKLLKQFKTTGFKNGDLVITAEIHRVVDKDWGKKNGDSGMEVVGVWPAYGSHIVRTGRGGQQCVMGLIKKGSK